MPNFLSLIHVIAQREHILSLKVAQMEHILSCKSSSEGAYSSIMRIESIFKGH